MNDSCDSTINNGVDNKDLSSSNKNTSSRQNSGSNKGQWERRLQTDINMAKQALCDALSLDKPQNPTNFSIADLGYGSSSSSSSITTTTTTTSNTNPYPSGVYASSAENIARLLQNFMKDTPKTTLLPLADAATERAITTAASSPSTTEEGGEGFDQTLFSFNPMDEVEDKPKLIDHDINGLITQGSLSLFEKWLFDEQSHDMITNNNNMSLEGQEVLF
ncbi:unnamed protein product [Thlaspi arvense]|uniref:Uncharacterized protein n=1 Tax=Thlaspi arvense TaxID=13288 RepID=A0AAU9STL0_THLAR|nr:unnamed protein product [Thlaspi arvense]